jgi:amino acid transporter
MFAYGTALLVLLEAMHGASWEILLLPVICGALAVLEGVLYGNRWRAEPIDRLAVIAFAVDAALSVVYVMAWIGSRVGGVSVETDRTLTAVFLLCVNATTFTSFFPLLRSTHRDPSRERMWPWIVWAFAYALLLLVTLLDDRGARPSLLVYPALNLALHAGMAVLATRGKPIAVHRFFR